MKDLSDKNSALQGENEKKRKSDSDDQENIGQGSPGPWKGKNGKGKGKGKNGKGLGRIPLQELTKLKELAQEDQDGNQICRALNSSGGCDFKERKFRYLCMTCKSRSRGAMKQHRL